MRFTLHLGALTTLLGLVAGVVGCGNDGKAAGPTKSCEQAMPVIARAIDADFGEVLAETSSRVSVSVGHSVNACVLALQEKTPECRDAFGAYAECLNNSGLDPEDACLSEMNAVDQKCSPGLEKFFDEIVRVEVPQPREGADIRNTVPVRLMKLGDVAAEMPRLLSDEGYSK